MRQRERVRVREREREAGGGAWAATRGRSREEWVQGAGSVAARVWGLTSFLFIGPCCVFAPAVLCTCARCPRSVYLSKTGQGQRGGGRSESHSAEEQRGLVA